MRWCGVRWCGVRWCGVRWCGVGSGWCVGDFGEVHTTHRSQLALHRSEKNLAIRDTEAPATASWQRQTSALESPNPTSFIRIPVPHQTSRPHARFLTTYYLLLLAAACCCAHRWFHHKHVVMRPVDGSQYLVDVLESRTQIADLGYRGLQSDPITHKLDTEEKTDTAHVADERTVGRGGERADG